MSAPPSDVLVVGLTAATLDALVRHRHQIDHLWNLSPEALAALIIGFAIGRRGRDRREGTG